MAWLNVSVLAGLGLVVVPIVLHLAMRQKPKHLVFPALRFVRQRSETNKRQLRLRHWLLLVLRCLAVAVAALLLARPSVASALVGDWLLSGLMVLLSLGVLGLLAYALVLRKGMAIVAPLAAAGLVLLAGTLWMIGTAVSAGSGIPIGDQEAPVAAVVLVDTSPRMEYVEQNYSRLEVAQETARELLRQLPLDSQVAILESRPTPAVFAVDRAAALKSLDRLHTTGTPRPLPELLVQALELAAQAEQRRKEIYVFTDLAEDSWPEGPAARELPERLAKLPDTTLYVIDVGIEDPHNTRLSVPRLADQTLAGQATLDLETELARKGPATQRTVELVLEQMDPTRPFLRDGLPVEPSTEVRDRVTRELPEDGRVVVAFHLSNLPPGTHHGRLQFLNTDSLAVDDVRYFTVVIRDPWRMLVVAGPGTNTTAWTEAVAPFEFREQNKAAFSVVEITPDRLATQDLSQYQTVCLLDPPPLEDAAWRQLEAFAAEGGGVAVFLGANAQEGNRFASQAAQAALGTAPTVVFRTADAVLAPETYDHPVLRPFQPFASSVPWSRFPVERHWGLGELAENTTVIARYSNREAALVEHRLGQGRVLTMTTPITELDRPEGRRSWNDLAGPNDWPRFILVNEIAKYLAGSTDQRWNYLAGESAVLENPPELYPDNYQLMRPNGELQTVRPSEGRLVVPWTDVPGVYRLKGARGTPMVRGFSVNLPDAASRLARLDRGGLDERLGEGQYQLATGGEELERVQGTERAGREFYPLLAAVLALVLGLEQAFSNRFYRPS